MKDTPPTPEHKLQPTSDCLQKTFTCTDKEIVAWRNCLFYRYASVSNDLITIHQNDYDSDDNPLSLPSWIEDPIPSCLAKSVLRIFYQGTKRVTLSLYATSQNTGTLLCQGLDCERWDDEECEALKDIVTQYCEDNEPHTLKNALISVPLTFLTENGTTISLSSPVCELNAVCPPPPSSTLTVPKQLHFEESGVSKNAPEQQSVAERTESPSSSANTSADSKQSENSTPKVVKSAKRYRRRTMCPANTWLYLTDC